MSAEPRDDSSQSTSQWPTAERFRSEAATTSAPASARTALMVEPFGDGSTRSPMAPAARIEPGDRLTPPVSRVAERGSASVAPSAWANACAESSRQR